MTNSPNYPEEKRITEWLNLNEKTKGKYGKITNNEWLEKEKNRIVRTGRRCEVIINPFNNTGALFCK